MVWVVDVANFFRRLLIRIVGDDIEIKALDNKLPVPTEFLVGSSKLAVYELSVRLSPAVSLCISQALTFS
jgi:hypothetical protein